MEHLRGPSPLANPGARHPELLGPAHRDGFGDEAADRVWDVCVIGSGASGAVAADRLVRQGLDVLMVEEGFRLAGHVDLDEAETLCRQAVARDDEGNWTDEGWPWTTSNLGGGTVFYGGASFRYQPFDFDPGTLIDTGTTEVRWPYTLAELAPYYEVLERRLGVCGGPPAEGSNGARHSRGPAHEPSAAARVLYTAGTSLGYKPFPTPLAINRDPYEGRAGCDRVSLCVSHACPTGAKGDVVAVFLAPLAAHPNFMLRTGVRAVRLEQNRTGEVSALRCLDRVSGQTREVRARAFVLACNAIQTAALLLRSRTAYSPSGVGNHSGLVGRGLCVKLSEYVSGVVQAAPEVLADPDVHKGPFSTVAFLDHYLDEDCPTGVGGLIYESKRDRAPKLVRDALELRIETILSDHPNLDNRVGLSRYVDEDGLPAIVLDYRTDPRDQARLRYMTGRCERLLRAAGADGIRHKATGFAQGSSHLHGTCRAGDDPARSVVDGWGRVHSADNVYVVDGSFMPYPGGLNPTLTIQAHALRTSKAVASQLAAPHAAHA
ncbi:GMC oxidoreductase [Streptomyces paromomycinus]|uniref:Glucose-methanol-choline oxidoreductase n=1 Tax=Streptomyces paromomycinus TaxID=92743 RepID=Q2MFN7_STREY|nr:GMC family oxidoreductase [Streptomyces paromomycinus]GCD40677.1 glucose-methanol-choline oxidoreductase [Streptomyces paromomycinus]CAF32378.1 putative paromomycin 6'-dehydrogenase [Streptomyces paromomycinus]